MKRDREKGRHKLLKSRNRNPTQTRLGRKQRTFDCYKTPSNKKQVKSIVCLGLIHSSPPSSDGTDEWMSRLHLNFILLFNSIHPTTTRPLRSNEYFISNLFIFLSFCWLCCNFEIFFVIMHTHVFTLNTPPTDGEKAYFHLCPADGHV